MRKTQTYKSLPYNSALRDKAKALRKAGFLHEALLWNQLKAKKFNGLDFDRQKIIGNYIVDFYCAEKAVVIEVDGSSHDNKQDEDAKRDAYLRSLGLVVIRLLVKDVLRNMEKVVFYLRHHPALAGTPPEEGNKKREAGASLEKGNKKQDLGHPSGGKEFNSRVGRLYGRGKMNRSLTGSPNSPPLEGWQAKPDGVVIINQGRQDQ